MTDTQVTLTGGPFDRQRHSLDSEGLLEILQDGLIHRYIATGKTQGSADGALPVYQYDGAVSPDGGMAGAENPRERLASPLADELSADS